MDAVLLCCYYILIYKARFTYITVLYDLITKHMRLNKKYLGKKIAWSLTFNALREPEVWSEWETQDEEIHQSWLYIGARA